MTITNHRGFITFSIRFSVKTKNPEHYDIQGFTFNLPWHRLELNQ